MPNYRRARIPGGVFFFTVVTYKRRPFFADERAVSHLREAFRAVQSRRPFTVDALVVLPDHLHCILRLPDGDADYASRWRDIKKTASKAIAPASNARRERSVWQRRFWEHTIRSDDDWQRHVEYIHYNPVKHGHTARPADWPWSSFSRFVAKGWADAAWGESEPDGIRGLHLE